MTTVWDRETKNPWGTEKGLGGKRKEKRSVLRASHKWRRQEKFEQEEKKNNGEKKGLIRRRGNIRYKN